MKRTRTRVTQEYLQRQWKSSVLILGVVCMFLLSFNAKAQSFEAGIFGGAAYYLGDLNPQKHLIESDIAFGGVLKYNLNKRLSLGFTVTRSNITSDAANFNSDNPSLTLPAENLSSQINEFALLGEINFFPYTIGDLRDFWTPYIFGGTAYFLSNHSNSFSLPFGVGIKLSLIENIGLNIFWGARKTFTDNLDNVVSIDYQGYNNDWYIFYGLNITFAIQLKKDIGCRNI